MRASPQEVYNHIISMIRRSTYGQNGINQYNLQKKRMTDMAAGGAGGTPVNEIMTNTSGHKGSIRSMHFSKWSDADFQIVLDALVKFDKTGEEPTEPILDISSDDTTEIAVEGAYKLFQRLEKNVQVDALNSLAMRLGVMDPEDLSAED